MIYLNEHNWRNNYLHFCLNIVVTLDNRRYERSFVRSIQHHINLNKTNYLYNWRNYFLHFCLNTVATRDAMSNISLDQYKTIISRRGRCFFTLLNWIRTSPSTFKKKNFNYDRCKSCSIHQIRQLMNVISAKPSGS